MLRVLVVGPDNLSADLGPTVLGRPDIDRVHVTDPAAAVDLCARARPTLVVVDLPCDAATTLVRELRADPRSRPCAIAWLNRHDPPEAETALVASGANVAIPYPIDPRRWDRRLEELASVPPRRSYRIPVRLRDWSHFVRGADEADAFVLNIGARGVLLETERELEPGCKLGLTFRLPGEAKDVGVVGQVVRFAGRGDDTLFRAGVEFLIYRGDARDRIVRFVESDPTTVRPGAPADALPLTVRPFEEALEWEEELRASEIRKALILDSALDCIVTADHDGRIVEFNSAARRLFGYSRAEVLGREVAETIVPPAYRAAIRRRLRALTQSGDTRDIGEPRETEAMRADGSLVPVQVFVFPAYVKGRLLLTAYIRDLTEKRREQRLAAARQRAVRTLAVSLSLAEAAPAVLDAVVSGLDCDESRLWLLEAPDRLALTSTSTADGPGSAPDETLARRAIDRAAAVWNKLDAGVDLAVPMRVGGQTLGALEARSTKLAEPDERWPELLADVASQLGLFLERQRAENELQRFARYDSLTGLPNRSFFRETLQRTLARAARERARLALIFVDLDGFKAVNDGLGHAAGDAALQVVAERLRAGVRTTDATARIGGDEFVVLLSSLSRTDDAALVARKLLDRVARPFVLDGNDVTLGASAGIAVYPEDGRDANDLLRAADLAMYRAKQEGRNTYRFFTAEMSDRALERMALLDGLRLALERQEFEIVYLPAFEEGRAVALEALLRWRHPKLGLVPPAAFIAEAEESGLILPLGVRVLRAATRFLASLAGSDVRLVVNLSPRQLQEAHLVETIRQTLEVSGLDPGRLELDLTLPSLMSDAEGALDRIVRLRDLGVRLSLDDFGTAPFSIPRLQAVGLQALKIDRSVVAQLPDSAEHVAQVEAILALARTLQIEAAAEGVETDAQRRFFEARGCTRLQGYLLSRPLEQAAVGEFLARASAVS
jgi:diguanylate cyclase (GGDEF)-like protein/PAS domain S-box-containing protein